jgi:hypothetical protein
MSVKQRYRKLYIGPGGSGERVTARNSHVGMTVLADYIDAVDDKRYLLFERQGAAAAPKQRKPRTPKATSQIEVA